MSRLLLVSNRLPVTVKHDRGELSVVRSAGGLATGLSGVHVSATDLTRRYFAGRADGLRPPNNAEELLIATAGR